MAQEVLEVQLVDLKASLRPLPTQLSDLQAELARLHRDPYQVNLRFTRLAQQLEKRFPATVATSPAGGKPRTQPPPMAWSWSMAPTMAVRYLKTPVWTLALPAPQPMTVWQALVEWCPPLGLSVYAHHIGEAQLHNGAVLRAQPEAAAFSSLSQIMPLHSPLPEPAPLHVPRPSSAGGGAVGAGTGVDIGAVAATQGAPAAALAQITQPVAAPAAEQPSAGVAGGERVGLGSVEPSSSIPPALLAALDDMVLALQKYLQPLGFHAAVAQPPARATIECTRHVGAVTQVIRLVLEGGARGQRVAQHAFLVYHQAIDNVWRVLHPEKPLPVALWVDGQYVDLLGQPRNMKRLIDVDRVAQALCARWRPLAEWITDVSSVDQLLNHPSSRVLQSARPRLRGARRTLGGGGFVSLFAQPVSEVHLIAALLNANPNAVQLQSQFLAHAKELAALRGEPADSQGAEGNATASALLVNIRRLAKPLKTWRDLADYERAVRRYPAEWKNPPAHPAECRVHHWEMADKLQTLAAQDPRAFMRRFGASDGTAQLQTLWIEHGQTLPSASRVAPQGISCEQRTLMTDAFPQPVEALLIQLPAITGVDETEWLAVAHRGDDWRCFGFGFLHLLEAGRPVLRWQWVDLCQRVDAGQPVWVATQPELRRPKRHLDLLGFEQSILDCFRREASRCVAPQPGSARASSTSSSPTAPATADAR